MSDSSMQRKSSAEPIVDARNDDNGNINSVHAPWTVHIGPRQGSPILVGRCRREGWSPPWVTGRISRLIQVPVVLVVHRPLEVPQTLGEFLLGVAGEVLDNACLASAEILDKPAVDT